VLLLKYLSDKSRIVLPACPEELLFMRELAEPLPSSALELGKLLTQMKRLKGSR
jgi:hypothetical protein